MDAILWTAARRLAHLVLAWLLIVGTFVGYDTLARRTGSASLAWCAWACILALVAVALLARSALRRSTRPDPSPTPAPDPYRSPEQASTDGEDGAPADSRARAQTAATALALLALATSFLVVAAASR